MTQYGVVIDESMIRNAVETTVLEATPLLSSSVLLARRALRRHARDSRLRRAAGPTALANRARRAPLHRGRRSRAAGRRRCTSTTPSVAFFGRENDGLRMQINPAYPLWAAATFSLQLGQGRADDAQASRRALRHGPRSAAQAGARRARHGRNGARGSVLASTVTQRDTNRYTRPRDVVNFPRVVSCGTSTAESVPCIFSGLGQAPVLA